MGIEWLESGEVLRSDSDVGHDAITDLSAALARGVRR
jgi:hypothetical protein